MSTQVCLWAKALAARTGFHTIEMWSAARRWFGALERR